jgi:hypothetical protein
MRFAGKRISLVALDNRLEHILPAVGTVDVAGS